VEPDHLANNKSANRVYTNKICYTERLLIAELFVIDRTTSLLHSDRWRHPLCRAQCFFFASICEKKKHSVLRGMYKPMYKLIETELICVEMWFLFLLIRKETSKT